MEIVCLDLEGVLIPEIWIAFADKTGIAELRATTRDIADYDELMTMRLNVLAQHKLGLPEIQEVIRTLSPLTGALEFTQWIRHHFQLIILSDTFYEFAKPMMEQLKLPTIFCHKLITDSAGKITNYKLRQPDQKRKAVQALHDLNFTVYAAGDSYNDTTMLGEADKGFLFHAPDNVRAEFPQFAAFDSYNELKQAFANASPRAITL